MALKQNRFFIIYLATFFGNSWLDNVLTFTFEGADLIVNLPIHRH